MQLSIIIPLYNEIDNVPKLKAELLPVVRSLAENQPLQVVFVDDGSADGTLDALQAAFAVEAGGNLWFAFEQHEVNRGLGAALRTGFGAATGEFVVTTDSDGTYRFETIPGMLAHLESGVDLVTASPYHPKGEVIGVPAYRLILSRGSSLLYRLFVNWRIHTYTCLYRAYRREVLRQVPFDAHDYLAGTEIMVKAMLLGYRVAEFPAVLRVREFGASKAKIAQTIKAHLKFQARVVLHRLGAVTLVPRDRRRGEEWA